MAWGDLEGRNGRIWQEYIRGATHAQIAERYGLAPRYVTQIIGEARVGIGEGTLKELVQESIDGLRAIRVELFKIVDSAPAPAYSAGRQIVDSDGNGYADHAGRLAAMRELVALDARVAKLIGLDAAAKLNVNVAAEAQEAATALGAAAAARLLADDGE